MPTSEPVRHSIESPTPAQLDRALGPWMATAVVVGNVIGSGIFKKPGTIAAESGNLTLILGIWCLAGVLCLLGALSIAELAAMLPRAGGLYVYVREAYGRFVAFLYGWTELVLARPASMGALAVAFVDSFSLTMGWSPPELLQAAMACGLIVALAWVNIIGVIWGGRVQLVVTVLKASFLVIVGAAPWLLDLTNDGVVFVSNFRSTVEPAQAAMGAQIAAVLLAVLWAYDGWHGVTPLAEEIRDPQRNVPRALFLGVVILIALYVAANIAYHGVLSMQEMKDAGDHAAERMVEKIAGPMGRNAMSFVIMCTTFGAINTVLLYSPRITFAVGRDTPALSFLSHVHGKFRSPARSIAANAVMALVLISIVIGARFFLRDAELSRSGSELTQRILQGLRDDSIFDLLTDLVIFSVSIFYALAVFAVVVLRIRRPDLPRPYRTWGYPVTPTLFLVVYVWFLWRVYDGSPLESHVGICLIAVGAPVYWLCHRFGPKATQS